MANTFTPSQLVSMVAGSYAVSNSIYFKSAYSDIPEFQLAATNNIKYKPGGTVDISLPYYLKAEKGLTISDQDIDEATIPYTLTDQDIFNTQYAVNSLESITELVGGQRVLKENPFKIINDRTQMTPSAKRIFNRYRGQQGLAILAGIDEAIAEKCRVATWYTPVDRPSKLKKINEFADISSVSSLADNLNFSYDRTGIMNIDDATHVANQLQNMFNEPINSTITKTAYVGGRNGGHLASFNLFNSSQTRNTPVSPEYTRQAGLGVAQPIATVVSVSGDGSQITFSGVEAAAVVIFNAGTHIAIPTVNLFNRYLQDSIETTLVVTASVDAVGDGAGNVTITLKEPLVATGGQANVNILPAAADVAEIFPAVRNNYFMTSMGTVANCLPMEDIDGAINARYKSPDMKMILQSIAQGEISTRVNRYRLDAMCPTLCIPRYCINLLGSVS